MLRRGGLRYPPFVRKIPDNRHMAGGIRATVDPLALIKKVQQGNTPLHTYLPVACTTGAGAGAVVCCCCCCWEQEATRQAAPAMARIAMFFIIRIKYSVC